MSTLEQRIEKAERAAGVGQEPTTITIIDYSGLPLPPERRDGRFVVRHVAYELPPKESEGVTEP